MDSVIIRDARVEDAEQVAKIHLDTWQCAYRGQLPDTYLDSLDYQDRLKTRKEILSSHNPNTRNLVAEVQGRIVGFLDLGPDRDADVSDNSGEIYAIYIDSQLLGRGIGTKLMQEAIKTFKEKNFDRAYLWALESNDGSRKFYEKHGWMAENKKKIEKRKDVTFNEIRYHIELTG